MWTNLAVVEDGLSVACAHADHKIPSMISCDDWTLAYDNTKDSMHEHTILAFIETNITTTIIRTDTDVRISQVQHTLITKCSDSLTPNTATKCVARRGIET